MMVITTEWPAFLAMLHTVAHAERSVCRLQSEDVSPASVIEACKRFAAGYHQIREGQWDVPAATADAYDLKNKVRGRVLPCVGTSCSLWYEILSLTVHASLDVVVQLVACLHLPCAGRSLRAPHRHLAISGLCRLNASGRGHAWRWQGGPQLHQAPGRMERQEAAVPR